MSLVANYGTDSESDSGDDAQIPKESVQSIDCEVEAKRNYLVTNEDDLVDSDDDDDQKQDLIDSNKHARLPNPLTEKLPPPELGSIAEVSSSKVTEGPGSVFANPFENAEMAKQSILEKHVKMTEAQLMTGKKAKICRSFKLGKCRFGKHCKYSHDLDANLSLRYTGVPDGGGSEDTPDSSTTSSNIPKHLRLPPPPKQGFMGTIDTLKSDNRSPASFQQRQKYSQQVRYMHNVDREDNDDDKFNVGDKRKKRVGVSQSLVPPKRAMSNLNKQRKDERPWTMNRR